MKLKNVFKILGVLAIVLIVVLTSPGRRGESAYYYRIGILNLADHGSLVQAREGFISRLEELGFEDGDRIQINYLNAQSDQSNLQIMATTLVEEQSDLILAISTPAAMAAANATSEIPILTSAVTSLYTANLVESNEVPNTNVSGTSDLPPVAEQIQLLHELAPDAQTIGFIFNSSEPNSPYQIAKAEEKAAELGLETVSMSVTNTNDVYQVMNALVQRVDAIYIPTDNTMSSAIATVAQIAMESQTVVVTGSVSAARNGGLATIGIDYYELGRQTADMAYDILVNGATPHTMPVQMQEETFIILNKDMAEALNFEFPQHIIQAWEAGGSR